MRSLNYICLFLLGLSLISCSKAEDPQIEFRLTYLQSAQWKKAETKVGIVYFDDNPGRSNLQQFLFEDMVHQLQTDDKQKMYNTSHWAGNFIGIQPQIAKLTLQDYDDLLFNIQIDAFNLIPVNFQLEQDKSYLIEFTIDPDEDFQYVDDKWHLDLSKLKFKLTEL